MQAASPDVVMSRPLRGRGDQRPCDFCRTRKTRCIVKDRLACERCQKSSRVCTFTQPPPRRRNKVGNSPLQASESPDPTPRQDLSVRNLPRTSDWENDFNFDWSVFPMPDGYGFVDSDLVNSLDGRGDAMDSTSSGSRVGFDLSSTMPTHPGLTGVASYPASSDERIFDEHEDYSIGFLGMSSDMDPFLRTFYVYHQTSSFRSSLRSFHSLGNTAPQPSIFVEMPRRVTDTMANLLIPTPDESLLSEIDPYRGRVFSLFERFIEPVYPICLPWSTAIPVAVKAAVYGMALPWRSHDPSLPWSQFDVVSTTRLAAPNTDHIWQFVWQSLSRDLHAPSLATVQACLLLIEREKSKTFVRESHFDWNLVTTAVSLAYELGLNLDPTSLKLSLEEQSQRQSLWWIIYIQERWSAATKGRPVLIKEEDNSVPEPVSIGEWSASSPRLYLTWKPSVFWLFRLTKILDRILISFTTVKKASLLKSNIAETISIANEIELSLKNWNQSFQSYSTSIDEDDLLNFGSMGFLRIALIYCHVLIHRTLIQATMHTPSEGEIYENAKKYINEIERQLRLLSILDLESFWFSWSRAQFNVIAEFFVLLCVVAPNKQHQVSARRAAMKHRQWLWVHSKSFGVCRMSMIRLDSLLSAVDSGKMRCESQNIAS